MQNIVFVIVDIGDTGRQSDGSIYNNGNIGYSIENSLLGIPKDTGLKIATVYYLMFSRLMMPLDSSVI